MALLSAPSHLLVRWLHVLAVAILLGGSALAWGVLRQSADGSGDARPADGSGALPAPVLRLAATYEWLFWAAVGVVVMTGVGNLGALAPAVPGPDAAWGLTLAVKLLVVLVFVAGSLVRTLLVVRVRATAAEAAGVAPAVRGTLRAGYGATTVVLVVVLALAEVLAHG